MNYSKRSKKIVGRPQRHLDKINKYLSDVGIRVEIPERHIYKEYLRNGDLIMHYTDGSDLK